MADLLMHSYSYPLETICAFVVGSVSLSNGHICGASSQGGKDDITSALSLLRIGIVGQEGVVRRGM